ncbi:hypothetical protein VHARVF571_460065 [Vibrio harveyi]|nr:hypothetical protein VHARVF571_460065 [Vibrio harveyi]
MQIAFAKCKQLQNMPQHALLLIPLSAMSFLSDKNGLNEKASLSVRGFPFKCFKRVLYHSF